MMFTLKMNNRGIYSDITFNPVLDLSITSFIFRLHRQTLVTRVDQDFDIRRVQTQAEKFLPKQEPVTRGRKRKAQSNKQKSSSVRWVRENSDP